MVEEVDLEMEVTGPVQAEGIRVVELVVEWRRWR